MLFRRRLLQKLHHTLAASHLIIAAPPGYGKTVLLRQLATYRPGSYYLPLTVSDGDTAVLQSRLQPLQQPGHALLLDDIHHLDESETAVVWLAEQLTHTACRYVLAGRFLPDGLALAIAKGQAAHWDERALLFAPEESQALLAGEKSADVNWSGWHEQLEGWPLGLGLVARLPEPWQAGQRRARQQLFTYLAQELLVQLPVELHRFMRLTAVPLHFNDDLASHLLGADATPLRQTIQRRNLFLYEEGRPGWFRYHDLIRDYLLATADFDLRPYRQAVVAWFEAQANLPEAIEHALAGGLNAEAARLIGQVSHAYIYEMERYLTYRRWVEALDSQMQAQHPHLLLHLGHYLHFIEQYAEIGRAYVEHALTAATAQENRPIQLLAQLQLASFDLEDKGATDTVLAELSRLADLPDMPPKLAIRARRLQAQALSHLARFPEALAAWRQALALALRHDVTQEIWVCRRNLAVWALVPLGRFAEAAELLHGMLRHFAHEPGWRYETLQNICELHFASGDWPALTAVLDEISGLETAVETTTSANLTWTAYYRALLAVANGQFVEAESQLDLMAARSDGDPQVETCLAIARCWLYRRRGQPATAAAYAAGKLQAPAGSPYYHALLSLERDVCLWASRGWQAVATAGEIETWPYSPTRHLIGWRARADLVRLRALLAVSCWRSGDGRWRRHVAAVRYALRQYDRYTHLLTRRDSELGLQFWRVALMGGTAVAEAQAALVQIGQAEVVVDLLCYSDAAVPWAQKTIAAAPWLEEAYRTLMRAYARQGQPARALKVYQEASAALEEELGMPPSPRTNWLAHRLRQGEPI